MRSASPGALTFLVAEYRAGTCGFTAFGAPGKPSERVAEEAAALLRDHRASGAAVDPWLADQLLPALALAEGGSRYTTDRASGHLLGQAALLEGLGLARVRIAEEDGSTVVAVHPARAAADVAVGP